MGKYEPPRKTDFAESMSTQKRSFDKKYTPIKTVWWIQETQTQHDEQYGGTREVGCKLKYGPYEDRNQAHEHTDSLNLDKEKTSFGYSYKVVQKTLYEYTTQTWF